MGLRDVQRNWEQFGEQDPLSAILTGRSDWTLDDFLHTGVEEVDEYIRRLDGYGLQGRDRVLDFGCGVGRLTQAFAKHFDECWGVDIAASMITRAQALNAHGDRVRYMVNDRPDLSLLPADNFDLVFSLIVLQHMEPTIAAGYIREFFRVCRPGGAVLFQIPHRDTLPPEAWAAEISALVPSRLEAGVPYLARTYVRNTGTAGWPGGLGTELRIANHWLDVDGEVLQWEDDNNLLQRDVAPGEAIEWLCAVTPPSLPGRYWLEFDIMQKDVGWFASRNSRTFRAPIRVLGAGPEIRWWQRLRGRRPDLPLRRPRADGPVMVMHQTARERVIEIIESSGGTLVDAVPDGAALPWKSFTYFARKGTRL